MFEDENGLKGLLQIKAFIVEMKSILILVDYKHCDIFPLKPCRVNSAKTLDSVFNKLHKLMFTIANYDRLAFDRLNIWVLLTFSIHFHACVMYSYLYIHILSLFLPPPQSPSPLKKRKR